MAQSQSTGISTHGFSYDVDGDKQTIVRGGTGLFTGRIPFIWLVNQVGDNGVIRAIYQASSAELCQQVSIQSRQNSSHSTKSSSRWYYPFPTDSIFQRH